MNKNNTKHPFQPLIQDENGVLRFKENAIVRYILDAGRKHGVDLNSIACMPFSNEDSVQFAQLIGYSLGGFGELSYVSNEDYETASKMHEDKIDPKDARIAVLEEKLKNVKEKLAPAVCELYNIHPDDLTN